MAKEQGSVTYSGNFQVLKSKPLDDRGLVDFLSDLTNPSTWTTSTNGIFMYKGLITCVANDSDENNGLYRLKQLPYTNINNWEKIGSSSSLDASSTYVQTFTEADLTENAITITHNLGAELVTFALYDDVNKYVLPDEVTIIDNNSLKLEIPGLVPMAGSYKIIILAQGGNPDVQPVSFYQEFTNTDLTDNKITFTHNLNSKGIICNVYDNLNTQIIPEEITLIDNNTLELDLGTHEVTGTFRIFIVAQGALNVTVPEQETKTNFVEIPIGLLSLSNDSTEQDIINIISKEDFSLLVDNLIAGAYPIVKQTMLDADAPGHILSYPYIHVQESQTSGKFLVLQLSTGGGNEIGFSQISINLTSTNEFSFSKEDFSINKENLQLKSNEVTVAEINPGPLNLADNTDYTFISEITHLNIASMTGNGSLKFATDVSFDPVNFTYPPETLFSSVRDIYGGNVYLVVYTDNILVISRVE